MQLNNVYREKLLNAIVFFAKKVKNPSKVKIFKLLYFLDFEHFKETGRNVTNLKYYAYDYGPVPKDFFQELSAAKKVPEDFSKALILMGFEAEFSSKKGAMFKAKTKADLSVFSPREKRILENLATIYKDVDGETISDISHLKNQPWDRTLKQKGLLAKIDYELAIDEDAKITKEEALEAQRERQEMLKAFPPLSKLHEG